MRNIIFISLFFFIATASAQNDILAKNYFKQGEFEKALNVYNKLYKKSKRYDYFNALISTYQQLERYDEAEQLIKQKLKEPSIIPQLYVELGYNYSLKKNDSLALLNYNTAIEKIKDNPNFAYSIGKAFEKFNLLEQAVETYELAKKLNPEKDFSYTLAKLYGEQGKLEKMFDSYLDLILKNRAYLAVAQQNFSLYITEDPSNQANIFLRKALLRKLQKDPNVLYNKLLSWLFIQQKEYKKAFTQEKAIYKRMGDGDINGIIDVAYIAIDDKNYKTAREIVKYLIENADTPEAKIEAYRHLMNLDIKTSSKKEYSKIEKQYEALLEEFGRGKETFALQLDYNAFLAYQNNKNEEAISNLKKLLQQKGTRYQIARTKMLLADILVFDEKFNQALIYYSQIQSSVKGDLLAQEARFKVAQTSYYKGDFNWAQVQLDVLKKSTSQLIANDAMQLSLLIKDNTLEDSTQVALKKYARADLLHLQKKETKAIAVLNEILENHKGEKIEDETLLKLGEIYEEQGDYSKAEASYLKLIQFYNDDILADDAHYRLAKLYETKLNLPNKAKEFYESIIFNFADSIYFVEARKKYRMLRGDEIE